MKQAASLILCSLALGIAFPPSSPAQRAAGGAPLLKPAKTPAVVPKVTRMDIVMIQAGPLKSAVDGLKKQMEEANLPPMNVIFGAGTTDLSVPDLQLRHVAGADALRLLCASAECDMEAIFSERELTPGDMSQYVIGYQIAAQNPRPRGTYTRATATSFGSMGGIPGIGSKPKPKPPTPVTRPGGGGGLNYTSPVSARKTSDSESYAGGGGDDFGGGLDGGTIRKPREKGGSTGFGFDGGGGAGLSDSGAEEGMGGDMFDSGYSSKPTPITRIYALGRVTSDVKFEEVEKTLIAVLAAAGQKPDQAKISLHESTNVLVVRGNNEIQDVVAQLLESLEKNQKNHDESEATKMKMRESQILSEMKLQQHRFEREIEELKRARAEAEAEARDLQKRLRDVQFGVKSKK